MYILSVLLSALTALAQTASFKGQNDRFAFAITLRDQTGAGTFIARDTVIESFDFTFTPRARLYSARDIMFSHVFGKGQVRLGIEDVDVTLTGTSNGTPELFGYLARIRLNESGRAKVNDPEEYNQFGFRLGGFGDLSPPHHLILLQRERHDGEVINPPAWMAVVGDGPLRKSLVECERILDPNQPDREEGLTFD